MFSHYFNKLKRFSQYNDAKVQSISQSGADDAIIKINKPSNVDTVENAWILYNECRSDLQRAKQVLASPELVCQLASYPFLPNPKFVKPKNGVAQTPGSLFAYLCLNSAPVALLVLTDNSLSRLLHDVDIELYMRDFPGFKAEITPLLNDIMLLKCDQRYFKMINDESIHIRPC